MLPEIIYNYNVSILLCGNTDGLRNVAHCIYLILITYAFNNYNDITICHCLSSYMFQLLMTILRRTLITKESYWRTHISSSVHCPSDVGIYNKLLVNQRVTLKYCNVAYTAVNID